MTCIVCDAPEPLGCEFCATPVQPITDRDPGDETAAVHALVSRSYRATYEIGGAIFFRDFICADDFLHAVEQAEDAREEGERLVNVRSQDGCDPIQLAHG